MGTFVEIRIPALMIALAATMLAGVSEARAATPMCDQVVDDSTIVTCTCTCEADSLFTGCEGLAAGTAAPTPNQCPDMLQGRRVLSRGDAVLVASPHFSGSVDTVGTALVYGTENDPSNAGLGVINGTPVGDLHPSIPCRMSGLVPFPEQVRFARLFDLPYSMVLILRPSTDSSQVKSDCFATNSTTHNMTFSIRSPEPGAPSIPQQDFQVSPEWMQLAIDDFDYDGFDDVVIMNIDFMGVWSAVDTTDPGKGIVSKHAVNTKGPSAAYRAPINEPTTGDFNGDGLKDVAWIGGDFPHQTGTLSVFFATVCPGDIAGTLCAGAQPFEIILDPAAKLFPGVTSATSTIVLDNASTAPTLCGTVLTPFPDTLAGSGSLRAGAIALGNFENNGVNARGAPTDELAILYVSEAPNTSKCSTDLQYWSFSTPDSSSPVWAEQRGATVANLFPNVSEPFNDIGPTISLYAQAAYLDWYGAVEQAVFGLSGAANNFEGTYYFPIIASVAGTGNEARISACAAPVKRGGSFAPYAWGVAAGRFSTSTTVNPANPNACGDFSVAAPGDCPYNLQIAMLVAQDDQNFEDGTTPPFTQLYSVRASAPGGGGPTCANDTSVVGFVPIAGSKADISGYSKVPVAQLRAGSQLHTGDAFGNSVQVGVPTVTRISQHTQPQLVIQAPPSLVDYVQPNSADSPTPAIVNFTRAPTSYQAQIEFDTSSEDTASTQNSHSFTASTTETLSGEVKFNTVTTVDIKNQESWSQYNESTSSEQLGTYSTTRLQTGGAIGADDQVWWTQTTFNVFHYPVLGETACPASLDCDDSDPAAIVCGNPTTDTVALTCSTSGDGCNCLSKGASASICPAIPAVPGARSCAEQGGDVCCSQLPQQLNVSFSGPEEVTRSSAPGASIEWYQPKHEPAQILSYPSSTTLLRARSPGAQSLANLNPFTTGTNDTSESISWTCGTSSNVSTGTTTRHSFDTDTSITAGTNKLAEEAGGVNVSFGFDYQGSGAISTLNSYSVGQTASSSIGLNLEGAGFFNVDQYAYSVAGIVLGAVKPTSVLDNPDLKVCPSSNTNCSTVDQVQADCTTTGPITVGFAADPTTDVSGLWWSSAAPYLDNIDVALNNPSRWRRVEASDVANASLQCRGDDCYASNQPTTGTDAVDVWDSLFYNMKGLLVTTGGTSGPLRDTAEVGDDIFLQTRVYNYSLKTMAAGTKVYARFYRQQLDVNNNNGAFSVVSYATNASGEPLPAMPIGPNGLGDSDPIPVVSPLDGSATIPPFNNTTDPDRDNISIATTSYAAAAEDACEYDNGTQVCNGAYYVYWMTVWAEDASGNVIAELAGHGLQTAGRGAFNPDTAYAFITDVPRETVAFNQISASFSNNVGMFKKVFTILPASSDTLAGPGRLRLDLSNVAPEKTVLGRPVTVSAQVVSLGAATPGATVVFTDDGDPLDDGEVFDAEWLPHIRADDAHFVRVNYNPETCGPHEIFATVAGGPRALAVERIALIDVGIDVDAAISFLEKEVWGLRLAVNSKADLQKKSNLVRNLRFAEQSINTGQTKKGVHWLDKFNHDVEVLERQGHVPPEKAEFLTAQSERIIGCVW